MTFREKIPETYSTAYQKRERRQSNTAHQNMKSQKDQVLNRPIQLVSVSILR